MLKMDALIAQPSRLWCNMTIQSNHCIDNRPVNKLAGCRCWQALVLTCAAKCLQMQNREVWFLSCVTVTLSSLKVDLPSSSEVCD